MSLTATMAEDDFSLSMTWVPSAVTEGRTQKAGTGLPGSVLRRSIGAVSCHSCASAPFFQDQCEAFAEILAQQQTGEVRPGAPDEIGREENGEVVAHPEDAALNRRKPVGGSERTDLLGCGPVVIGREAVMAGGL